VEVVADEDVVGAQPGDEVVVGAREARAAAALPKALLAVSAGGQGVEDAVVAELDVEEEEGQDGSLNVMPADDSTIRLFGESTPAGEARGPRFARRDRSPE